MASVGNETQCLIQSTGQILLLFGKLGIVPATPKVCVRILFITGAVATYLLYEFYMATLTSYISVADPPKTITQLQDVLKLKYNLVTWGDSLLEQAFSEVMDK